MLERTSACLDTGVRLSLRQKSLFPKSRRLLHSSFWSTTAPDVDHLCLPIASPSPSPSTLSSSAVSASSYSADTHDAPFLDFLYPVPTQAFMTRLSQWERWSRKNNRPSVLRGYSSLTTPKDSSFSSSSRPHQELRNLLESSDSEESLASFLDVERVWNLCSQIAQSESDLLPQAIIWFSKKDDKAAHTHAVHLFADLPDKLKSTATYNAAISSNLYLNRETDAITLHQAASLLPLDGPIASSLIMARAVSQMDWPLAISVLQEWETYTSTSTSRADKPRLWDHATRDLGDLRRKLDTLRKLCHVKIDQRSSDSGLDEPSKQLRRLYGIMLQEFVAPQSRKPDYVRPGFVGDEFRGHVKRQIELASRSDLISTKDYDSLLSILLTLPRGATNYNCSAVVAFVYDLYRRSKHFSPSRAVLMLLTKHWRDHNLAFAGKGSNRTFIGKDLLLQDWTACHGKPDDLAIVVIMDTFARRGLHGAVKEHADLYKSLHPEGLTTSNYLWPLIYVHAINMRPTQAAEQLDRFEEEYGVSPGLRLWNIALHAYEQADDLVGADSLFRKMLEADIQPDRYTYGSLLNLYAKRGDIDGVIDLLDFAKSNGVPKPTTHMLNSMIVSLTNNHDNDSALRALNQTVRAVKDGEAEGPLTLCFNTLLVANAHKRDLQATMATYRRMKEDEVPLDERSYGALMQALCSFRQSPSAHKVLKSVMPASNIRPMAFHYSILMAGYLNQEMFSEAIGVEAEMIEARVRPTPSSRAIALKARALYEQHKKRGEVDESGKQLPLELAIEDYKKLLGDNRTYRHGKQPSPGFRHESGGIDVLDAGYLMYIHGQQRSYEAVQHLFQLYQDKLAQSSVDASRAPIMRLLTTLMSAHCQAGEFAEVDKYWDLVKSRVDEIRVSHIPASELVASERPGPSGKTTRDPETAQIPKSYRFMLSRPLGYYIESQFAQSSPSKLQTLIMKLLSQGYEFDNRTWNKYIVHLCQTSPPRALLAYSLVEKFMMKDWPGWLSQRHGLISAREKVFPKKQARKEGLEYIKTRYLSPGQLIPHYRTMVYLASALLEVRGLASSGLSEDQEPGVSIRDMRKQVGTIPDIREEAPLTLHAVQSMPRIVDKLQANLLGAQ
ncbi:hypothetical protein D6D29_08098 [Aureobasidium pullulans]|nr:hypothetical protein D6D29_08098 [Aureobasidium pullulans]